MELLIKSINGIRNIEINEKCNVIDLKKKIEELYGAFPEEQQLYFGIVLLDDDNKLLTSYGIKSKCEIIFNINFSEFTVIVSYNNQTSEIKININETGIDLKNKIQRNLNKPVVEQYLLYKDKQIEDNQKLSIYGLTEKSVIILVDKVTKEYQTLVVRLNEKDNFNINYVDKIRVEDVLKQVEEKCPNINMEHSILLDNKVLNRQATIERNKDYPFQSLIVQISNNPKPSYCKMKIVIKPINGDHFTLAVNNNDTIEQLKKEIEKYNGFSPLQQKLIFKDNALTDNNEKLLTCGIIDGSCVSLSLYPSQFMLIIHVQDKRILNLLVESSNSLMFVKKELQRLVPLHIDEQLLLYQGVELTGNRLLSEYNILDSCCLKLLIKLRDKVDLVVNFLDKKKFPLTICSNQTIYDIKCMVQEKCNISPAEQRLIMNCRILEDNETVSECFTNEKKVINLLHQKRTGFLIFVKSPQGCHFQLEVRKTDRIIDLKTKLENTRGWKVKQQKIIFQGKILNNEEIIDNCAFEWNSVINVVLLNR